MFTPSLIIFNSMIKQAKNFYLKCLKKKSRPFTKRIGDWICCKCNNLNFGFRNKCNRCKIPKKDSIEFKEEN